eukprot:CAMPEP_0197295298 /NCGR_PEP_ID=MMETSP0890-20130614/35206_1 /TAXON_ID=44058 ORGANISM="Aureoumbra lagunensis, Strain CCMP1510" /NCGR_SAMPLE_ID=MMETSP0890 /ASSEMBLY_ACC=CAM_ASM_000533 /LENGTH=701 /DNA_ID=CAMNT_0042771211 /DNA_START=43 /DNA_END=2148 /DNA_ORIENTATION=-
MMRTTVDELLEAERLHRRALAAEAKASAVQAAAERGVVLNKMNEEKKVGGPVFIPRSQREVKAEAKEEANRRRSQEIGEKERFSGNKRPRAYFREAPPGVIKQKSSQVKISEEENEFMKIRATYLGDKESSKKKVIKPSEKLARVFKFEWDTSEDTSQDYNPLYANRHKVQPLLGRGYIAGIDLRAQRQNFAQEKEEEEQINVFSSQRKRRRGHDMVDDDLSHWSKKSLEAMTERDWRIMKEDFDIRVRGGRAPYPLRKWNEAGFALPLLQAIQELGYENPSPIQRQAIPVGLALRDVIGIAETGSGKTAAFAIPMLDYVYNLPKERITNLSEDGPLALVLAPTRELAAQISEEILKLAQFLPDIKCCTIVGGASVEDQAFRLREGVEIIVGTPGRLNDCLERQYLVLNQANYVILDEADRMIDMGFEPQVHSILESMGGLLKSQNEIEFHSQEQAVRRGEIVFRVTAMFSATMPPPVERLAKKFLRHPVIVSIGDEDSNKNKRIKQHVILLKGDAQKRNALIDILLKNRKDDKVLIFCNEKKGCDALSKFLQSKGIRTLTIHGGKAQDQREASLHSFKNGRNISNLIATDVAGRGLDIPNVSHVINFDMPLKIENYSHRIGRTGRAGKSGLATTLLTSSDEPMFYDLYNYLEQTDAEIPPSLANHPAAHAKPGERNARGELLTEKASFRAQHGKVEFIKE